jgi:di/tricarboxylate transporter
MLLVFALVAFTVAMLILEWIRADLLALLVLSVIAVTGLIAPEHVFHGFAGNAVIAIIAIMIMGEGLDRTGVLGLVASFVMRVARGRESRLGVVLDSVTSVLSAVIPSQALAALMLPISSRLSARTGIPLQRLLLPMAFCILTATNTTLIANSPLILLNDLVASANSNLPPGAHTIHKFGLFSVTPVGAALAVLGVAYFALFRRRILPVREDLSTRVTPGRTQTYFAETYGIDGEVRELVVSAESPLVGMSVAEAERLHGTPLVLALKSGKEARLAPPPNALIWVGSVLGVLGKSGDVTEFANRQLCRMRPRLRDFARMFDASYAGISEAVVPPGSRWPGKTVRQLDAQRDFGVSLLALDRSGSVYREDLGGMTLQQGDTLVLYSAWNDLGRVAESRDIAVVTDYPKREQRPRKIWTAVFFFALAKGLALFTTMDISVAMMTGATGMLLTGVLTMDEAYGAINWKTIFVTACLLPLGWSMDSTGAATWLAQHVLEVLHGAPQWVLQASIGVLTLLFSQVMSNVGATVMMVPIAISIALATGGKPPAYAMLVAISSSNTFLIPSGHPALMMVSGAGAYRVRDFLRAGLPLTVAMLIVTMLLVNLIFG